MKGLILAGGLGKRARPLTYTEVKQLIPIANKPVVFYAIESLVEAGIAQIGVIVGHTEERIGMLRNAIGDGSRWGAEITYIEQDKPRGLAHAVYCAKDYMGGEPFVVYLGDNILMGGIVKYVQDFQQSSHDAAIVLTKVKEPWKYGVATLNEKGEVVDIEEKPENPKSDHIITGIYLFRPSIFEAIEKIKPSQRGELEITHAIREILLSKNQSVLSYATDSWWDDTGDAEAILRANHMILSELHSSDIQGEVEETARLLGHIRIGKGSVIRGASVLRGPLVIGENCNISSAYIGPFTSIGDNTTVIGGEVESSIVIGDTRIEFGKRIVDSLIGRYSTITSSTMLPNGPKLVIGDHSSIQL